MPPQTTTTPPPKPTETPAEPPKDTSLLNDGEKKTDTPKEGVPEKYDFKLPDGFEIAPEVATSVTELFKKHGLNQNSAQELLDFYIKHTQDAQEAPYKAYADMRQQWKDQTTNHPEIAGKLPEVKANIGKLYDVIRAADPQNGAKIVDDFRQVMDLTGAGDNPAFVVMWNRVAKMLTENSRHVTGNSPSQPSQTAPGAPPKDAAHAVYPNLA